MMNLARCGTLFLAPTIAVVSCGAFVGTRRSRPFIRELEHGTRLMYSETEQHATETTVQYPTEEKLRTLYPALDVANRNGTIAVDDMHTLFYQEYGQNSSNKDALTALFLHGGPGAGCNANHARFFDPDKFRIVLLDQRGCGESTPIGQVERNTLKHLVQDCEAVRIELGIDTWDLILGGSWGTTLALAYAQTYPKSVRSMVLRGVCLLRPSEVDWLLNSRGGAASLDPGGWKNFSTSVDVDVDKDDDTGRAVLHAHYDRLLGDDPIARIHAARSWMMWEMRISSLAKRYEAEGRNDTDSPVLVWTPGRGWSCQDSQGKMLHQTTWYSSQMLRRGLCSLENDSMEESLMPRQILPVDSTPSPNVQGFGNKSISNEDAAKFVPAQAMLTCFYSVNERYATDNLNLLDKERMDCIRTIPCVAVQGGLDTICPPDTALDLHEVWPEMELRIPSNSGHSMYDPAITNELVQATDFFATQLTNRID